MKEKYSVSDPIRDKEVFLQQNRFQPKKNSFNTDSTFHRWSLNSHHFSGYLFSEISMLIQAYVSRNI
jgi:hypothetical protein